jgi:hypothetical protein
VSDSKKPTFREVLEFLWDTKIFLSYLKFAVAFWVVGGLVLFLYWLIAGEIPQ